MDESTLAAAAVLISVLSLVVAAVALGWNIYRDVVLKGHLRVGIAVAEAVHTIAGSQGTFVNITGTNHGPGDLIVNLLHGKRAGLSRQGEQFIVIQNEVNPLADALPKRLAVGETVSLLVPYGEDCLLKDPVKAIGLRDSFGKTHWAPRRELEAAGRQYLEDFPGH
jgi:hypothetical protein